MFLPSLREVATPCKVLCKVLPAIFFLVLVLGCSRAEPKIAFHTIKLVYYEEDDAAGENTAAAPQQPGQDGGSPVKTVGGKNTKPHVRLSFFVLPDDPDGPNDLEELRLYHDGDGLMWSLKSDDWIKVLEDGKTWVGSHNIAPPDGENFPSGRYRAEIIDKGGDSSGRAFGFEAEAKPLHEFPTLKVQDSEWFVECSYPQKYFLCYNAEGRWLSTVTLKADTGTITTGEFDRNTLSIALWGEDVEHSTSAVTKRVAIR
jgi:hypothetical protein